MLRRMSSVAALVVLVPTVLTLRSLQAVDDAGTIAGTVTNASGEPVAGAFVKLRNAERKLTFLVVSQAGGRYQAAKLPAGTYQVQAVAAGMQNDPPATTDLKSGANATLDVTLGARMPDGSKPPTPDDYGKIGAWNTHLPATPPTGESAKYTVVEFALTDGANPHDIAVDSKGIAWVSERVNGIIGRFDPESLTYTRISVPGGKSGKFYLSAIAVDPQDRVWMIDAANRRLVRYEAKTQAFEFFPVPEPDKSCAFCVGRPPHERFLFNAIRFHPDGSVWGTQIYGSQIVRLDPATNKTVSYPIPSHIAGLTKESGAHPYGMAIDGSRRIWFAQNGGKRVGMLDPATGKIAEYEMPFFDSRPRRMAADANGDLWFCMGIGDWAQGGKLAHIDHRSGKITYFDPPTAKSGPSSPDVDLQRNLIWFSETAADQIARFDFRTKTFVEFALPTWSSLVRRIEVDRSRPDRVWFSGSRDGEDNAGYDKIGYLEVLH